VSGDPYEPEWLPKQAVRMADGWHANGLLIYGDENFLIAVASDGRSSYSGIARLVHDEGVEEDFPDHLLLMSEYVFTVWGREQRRMVDQHKVVLVRGWDLVWRVAPTDKFSAGLLFGGVKYPKADPVWLLAESVLALVNAQQRGAI
jgi:hypothetical protein